MPSANDQPRHWRLSPERAVPLARPVIMGIVNLTPDSFWDGGSLANVEAAVRQASAMVSAGAAILDLGAESTRPGAARVSAPEQIARLIPALKAIRAALPAVPITIDTTLVEVARAAIDAGADGLNDVSAGEDSAGEMLALAAEHGRGIILMHRLAPPDRDRYSDRYEAPPAYADVVADVGASLRTKAARALELGVPAEGIVLDPGLGFGKTVAQNLELIARNGALIDATTIKDVRFPILSALSRKSFVGRASLGRDSTPDERLPGTLSLSVTHLGDGRTTGASIFRVHDVPEHKAALAAAFAAVCCGDTSDA